MVVLDTPQDRSGRIIFVDTFLWITTTPVQYRSGRIINYQINSKFWDKI